MSKVIKVGNIKIGQGKLVLIAGPCVIENEEFTLRHAQRDARDLGQETFLRVWRQAGRYRPEGKFRSWLLRIAGNLGGILK